MAKETEMQTYTFILMADTGALALVPDLDYAHPLVMADRSGPRTLRGLMLAVEHRGCRYATIAQVEAVSLDAAIAAVRDWCSCTRLARC